MIFFSRDFLAKEFSRCNEYFKDLKRVYIVTSLKEEITVSSLDRGAIIFNLLTHEGRKYGSNETGEFVNRDRFLRNYSGENIVEITGLLESVLDAILAKVKPKYYLDEPVSGYTNYFFNKRLAEAGAL